MKNILTILLLLTSFIATSQIDVSRETKEKDGIEYLVFTFTNTTDEYVNKGVTISYMYYDGKLYHPYKEKFSVSLSPNEVYTGNLSYTTRDNKMILAKTAGSDNKMKLQKVEVSFEPK